MVGCKILEEEGCEILEEEGCKILKEECCKMLEEEGAKGWKAQNNPSELSQSEYLQFVATKTWFFLQLHKYW